MRFFGKKKETKECCCAQSCTSELMRKEAEKGQENGKENEKENRQDARQDNGQNNKIRILGSGCAKCMELERAVRKAVCELQADYEIDHVTDFAQIAGYGVMSTPALVFQEKVISYGKVLTVEEIKVLLEKNR